MSTTTRPQPLRDVAMEIASTRGVWMSIIATLVSGGIIGASAGSFLTSLAGLVFGAATLVATCVGAMGVATTGEKEVTPVSNPMIEIGGQLVRLVPDQPHYER